MLLLPPFPFDRRIWAANAAALLAAGRRVIAVDYPGFGETPPLALDGPLTIAAIADAVAALLDRLELRRATLVGLSMGGYVALAFLATFADRVDALVLADTRAAADSPTARQGRAQALDTLAQRGADAYLEQSLPKLLAPDATPALLAVVQALAERRPATLAASIAALRDRPDRSGLPARIACPTLVLVGARDQITPPAEMRALATAIAGARFTEIAGAGHLSNLEAPAAFNGALLDFLNARRVPPSSAPPAAAGGQRGPS